MKKEFRKDDTIRTTQNNSLDGREKLVVSEETDPSLVSPALDKKSKTTNIYTRICIALRNIKITDCY